MSAVSFDPTTMQIGNLPVLIAGDVNADVPVLHEATDEGFIAGTMLFASGPSAFNAAATGDRLHRSEHRRGRPPLVQPGGRRGRCEVDLENQGRLRMSGGSWPHSRLRRCAGCSGPSTARRAHRALSRLPCNTERRLPTSCAHRSTIRRGRTPRRLRSASKQPPHAG
jgi:hypothetical protein